jgi:hypothetical protein
MEPDVGAEVGGGVGAEELIGEKVGVEVIPGIGGIDQLKVGA